MAKETVTFDDVEHIAPPVEPGTPAYYVDGGRHTLTPCRVLDCIREADIVTGRHDPDPWEYWRIHIRLNDGSELHTNGFSVYVLAIGATHDARQTTQPRS